MPVLTSSFRPPFFLRQSHVQTILPAILPRRFAHSFTPERLELPDGDFLDLGWLRQGSSQLVILTHGLEGSIDGGYIRGTAQTLHAQGWDALAWNFRNCGVEPNRLLRSYHSGESGDLGAVVRHAAASYRRIALVGFSLGGNVTLKYLGEAPPHPAVVAGVAISAPVHLASCARALDSRWANKIYLQRFLATLVQKAHAKAARFPDRISHDPRRRIDTITLFDDLFTAPLHGFRDALDYWTQASARQYLPGISIPALLINAHDDPLLGAECFPYAEATASRSFSLEAPKYGGHVGFLDLKHGIQPWTERRIAEFLREHSE